jgi:astacin (peptidase family M12A)
MSEFLACSPRFLPTELQIPAAQTAFQINPVNRPAIAPVHSMLPAGDIRHSFIAALTTKYWHGGLGVHLTVGFLDDAPPDLRERILSHMNAWGATANVEFVQSDADPQVRIARQGGSDGGYWSYLGTDILLIEADQPTMNLEAFSMDTPESEFHRVVRHETGHTLGFPHEHMRQELVDLIDVDKAIAFFEATQGWNAQETEDQVLTPIEESFLIGTAPDPESIMCYQIPGTITKNGDPIIGGTDIDNSDAAFAGSLYPKDAGRSS